MSNYVIKSDLKRGVGINTSKFAEKVGLSNLASDINRLDIDELEITTVDLSKQSNILKKMLLERHLVPVNLLWPKSLINERK